MSSVKSELSELIEDAIEEFAEGMLDNLAGTLAALKFAIEEMEDDAMGEQAQSERTAPGPVDTTSGEIE